MTISSEDTGDIFPDSRWTLVHRAQKGDEEAAHAALNELCKIYWYPIYAYIRRSGKQPEEAEDLTQGYFASLLDRDYLAKATPERGKLRAFLLTDLKFYLSNHWRHGQAVRRGSGITFVPIDTQWAEDHYTHEPANLETPAELFDRKWAVAVLGNVLEQVREKYVAKDRELLFTELKPFLSWNAGEESYAEVGARLGRDVNYVKVNVQRLRKLYRETLEFVVSQTVTCPAEVREEIRYLASAVC